MEDNGTPAYEGVFEDIGKERIAQDERWGKRLHTFPFWLTIFGKQVGHLSEEVLEYTNWCESAMDGYRDAPQGQRTEEMHLRSIRMEAIQAASVLTAMIEQIDERLYPDPGLDEPEEGSEPEYPDGMFTTEVSA